MVIKVRDGEWLYIVYKHTSLF